MLNGGGLLAVRPPVFWSYLLRLDFDCPIMLLKHVYSGLIITEKKRSYV